MCLYGAVRWCPRDTKSPRSRPPNGTGRRASSRPARARCLVLQGSGPAASSEGVPKLRRPVTQRHAPLQPGAHFHSPFVAPPWPGVSLTIVLRFEPWAALWNILGFTEFLCVRTRCRTSRRVGSRCCWVSFGVLLVDVVSFSAQNGLPVTALP